jgi:sorting nexin-29
MFDPSASQIVAQFYEESAVISCPESRQSIIEAVNSLEGILFAISIDRAELNKSDSDDDGSGGRHRKKEHEEPLPVFPTYSSSPSQLVRKAAPRIVCLADDDYSNDSDGPASRQTPNASLSSTPTASELRTNKLLLTPLEEDARSVGGLSCDDRTSNDLELERELTSSDEVKAGDEDDESESLTREVSRLREERDQLSSQMEQLKKMHAEKTCRCENLIENLSKENDILKVQVKKYLSAIQMLNLKDEKSITPIADDDLIPSYVLFQEVSNLFPHLIRV